MSLFNSPLDGLFKTRTLGYYYDRGYAHGSNNCEVSQGWLDYLYPNQKTAFNSGKKDGEAVRAEREAKQYEKQLLNSLPKHKANIL